MVKYKVVEKFVSINGEGKKAGQLAVFIRFQGCNLRCSYCDTMWANEKDVEYEYMSCEDIYNYVKENNVTNITLTGGEPLLQKGISSLIKMLMEDGNYQVEIETNGSISIEEFMKLDKPPAFTIDYKLPASGMEEAMDKSNFELLQKKDTVKFVISDMNDLIVTKNIIKKYNLIEKCSVYLSPVFNKIDSKEIVNFMIDNNLNKVNVQIQMHKIIWDSNSRGV
ncbi:putative 7-carboxy-7-deazaguanine synthase QueE [Clostridium disporicum]|uniref:7-carboxy-7-deazaguanine synthase n=1 Tax=Clostridium disporicum TaxID=84024 RepID=A0A174ELU8_9CLOT|nr:putative 7-carboxy-7-deazaguanine synthase QueE [Clostridium disporicum]CUO38581.1 radical SAM domain-containing protein [Clostridium disporicum]